jgi:hypothetical protein
VNPWWYIFLGMVSWPFVKVLLLAINRAIVEHRMKRFLKLVSVTFSDKKTVTLISLDSSDKRSMKRLERQLREQHGLPETATEAESVDFVYGDGFRN